MSCSPITASPGASKPGLERQHGHRNGLGRLLAAPRRTCRRAWSRRRRAPTSSVASRSRAPLLQQATITRLPSLFEPLGMSSHGIEDVGAFGLALGGEGAALPAAEGDDTAASGLRALERIEHDHVTVRQRLLPLGLAQEQALGRHRMIRRRAEGLALERLRARVVMIGDLLEPLRARVVDQRIERDGGVRQIVEQRGEAVMEERQPMLHALVLAPGRDRLVKRVVAGDRAEQLDIALAEGAPHLRRQRHLAHGKKLKRLAPPLGPLRGGIEGAAPARACRRRNRGGSARRPADRGRGCRRAPHIARGR